MKLSKFELFFTKRRVIALAILWVLTNIIFQFGPWSLSALQEVSGTHVIPDLKANYDREFLIQLFTQYGSEGISIYKNLQIIDFIYPLIYGSLLLGLFVRVKIPSNIKVLFFSNPFTIVFFDYAENLILRHLINVFPNLDSSYNALITLCSLITMMKWSFIGASVLTIIFFWVRGLVKKQKS